MSTSRRFCARRRRPPLSKAFLFLNWLQTAVHAVHVHASVHCCARNLSLFLSASSQSGAQQAAVQARQHCMHLIENGSVNEADAAALKALRQSMINHLRSLHS